MEQQFGKPPREPRVVGWTGTGNHNARPVYAPAVTMEMVLVLMYAQVLFAYYYIGARFAGLEIVRVW